MSFAQPDRRSRGNVARRYRITDDAAIDIVDTLNGRNSGEDWFIYSSRDKVTGMTSAEANTDLRVS